MKPAWYVDADTLGLAHVLVRARHDVTFPGDDGVRHRKAWRMDPCIINDPATHDNAWIPAVAQAGMAIITRDKHIAMRTAEINEPFQNYLVRRVFRPDNEGYWQRGDTYIAQPSGRLRLCDVGVAGATPTSLNHLTACRFTRFVENNARPWRRRPPR